MRWKRAKRGDVRVIAKFLWFPVNINGDVRWLEKVRITQEYRWGFWMNDKFMD